MKKYIVAAIAAFLQAACGKDNKPVEVVQQPQIQVQTLELTQAQFDNAGIETAGMKLNSLTSVVQVTGKIDVPPQNLVSVSIPAGGYLKYTKLLPGMKVRKGEVIAEMEDPSYVQLQQQYLTAQTSLVYLEKEYFRQKELNITKSTSDKEFQIAEMDWKNRKIELKALGEQLRLIGIIPDLLTEENLSRSIPVRSPIDGFVSSVKVNIGKYVTPSEVLFELVNPTDIHLNINVFEKDISKIAIGQKVIAYTNHAPQRKYPCEIILIGHDIADDRSVEVHCHFEEYDPALIPGMFMNAEVEVVNTSANTLPEDAFVRVEGKTHVFVVRGPKMFELVPVETGITHAGLTEVIGSNPGIKDATFVTKGAYTLLMMLKGGGEE